MSTIFDLTDRHFLVTGASSGLGRHFAVTLTDAGANVTLTARRHDELEITAASVRAKDRVQILTMDVRDRARVRTVVEEAEARFGPLTGLVNNAGIATVEPALTFSEDGWDTQLDTNLKGAWNVLQAVAQAMQKNNVQGSIINITSIVTERVVWGTAPYTAAKAGLKQLTKLLALEWAAYGIRVNAIAPGIVRTALNKDFLLTDQGRAAIERIPQRRAGEPSDLDGPLLLLASDASSFMTGSVIVADGGHSTSPL